LSCVALHHGDCLDVLRTLDDSSVHCCVTSPPYYGLRDYGCEGQIGLEETPDAYVAKMVDVFREVRRVLRDDGTLWLNLGDSYVASACGVKEGGVSKKSGLHGANRGETYRATLAAGHGHAVDKTRFGLPPKNLIGIPWRVAFALQADGWWLRQDIIWHKPNPMPESVRDRCTKAHEYVFLMAKAERYYFDAKAISEELKESSVKRNQSGWNGNEERGYVNGPQNHMSKYLGSEAAKQATHRNRRSVWTVSSQPFKGAHFATFPPKLIEPCILAGCPVGGTVLDPFGGSGTTGMVAIKHGRAATLIELNAEYVEIAKERIGDCQSQAMLEFSS